MAEHEEQVDWEDADDGQDFWRGPEAGGAQVPATRDDDDDDDDVISLLGDVPETTTIVVDTPAPAAVSRAASPPSSPPLPAGWTSHMSRTHQRKYYIFAATSERRWERPAPEPLTPPLSPATGPETVAPAAKVAPTAPRSSSSGRLPTGPAAGRTQKAAPATAQAQAQAMNADQNAASAYANRRANANEPSALAPPSGPRNQKGKRRAAPRTSRGGAPNVQNGEPDRDVKRQKTQANEPPRQQQAPQAATTNPEPFPRSTRPPPSGPANGNRDQRDQRQEPSKPVEQYPRQTSVQAPQPRQEPRRAPAPAQGVNTAPIVNSKWGNRGDPPSGPSQPARTAPAPTPAPKSAANTNSEEARQAEIQRAIEEGIRLGREQERKRIADEEATKVAKQRLEDQAAERKRVLEQQDVEARKRNSEAAAPPANRWGKRGAQAPEPDRGFPPRQADGPSRGPSVDSRPRDLPPRAQEPVYRRSPERREPALYRDEPRGPPVSDRPPFDRYNSGPRNGYDSHGPRGRSPEPAYAYDRRPRSPSPRRMAGPPDDRFTRRPLSPRRPVSPGYRPRPDDRFSRDAPSGRPRLADRMEPRIVVAEPMARRSPPRNFPPTRPPIVASPMSIATPMAAADSPGRMQRTRPGRGRRR